MINTKEQRKESYISIKSAYKLFFSLFGDSEEKSTTSFKSVTKMFFFSWIRKNLKLVLKLYEHCFSLSNFMCD